MKILKIGLSILILAVLIFSANLSDLLEAIQHITLFKFGMLMLISFALIGVSAWKWQLFIDSLAERVNFVRLFSLYLVGYFVNLIVPSYIGGDALRSFYVGRQVGHYKAAAATILERYTGLLAMVSLALVGIVARPSLEPAYRWLVTGLAAAIFLLTAVLLFMKLPPLKSAGGSIEKFMDRLAKLQEVVVSVKQRYGLLARTMALSFLYHLLTVANTIVAAQAVGWEDPPIKELLVILPVVLCIGAIPLTPSGLGLQEGAFFYFLQLLGATPAQALGVGVLLRAKSYVLALLGWLIWLRDKPARSSSKEAHSKV